MYISRIGITAILIAMILSAACKPSAPQQRYDLKGKVVAVDNKGSTVTVAHDSIPGYMEAMTMPFKLKDERLLRDIAEGDRLQATLVVAGLRSWLEDVVVTRETVDTSDLSKGSRWTEPKPGDEVPNFTMINQNGKRFSFHQYRGSAVIVTFIYTRCPLPDYCPLMTDNFSELLAALKSEPEKYPAIRLLSITLDPEYDSPKVLREYAAAHSVDPALWDYATGTKAEIKEIATFFGLQYWTEGDQVIHSLRTAIIGPGGNLIKLYRGNEWKPSEILKEIRKSSDSAIN